MIEGTARTEGRSHPRVELLAEQVVFSQQALRVVAVVLGVALATFVLFLYVLPNSQIDAAKVRIVELQAQKAAVQRQNAAILQEIARRSDLTTLEARARELGMGPATSAIYLRLPASQLTEGAAGATRRGAQSGSSQTSQDDKPNWLDKQHWQDTLRELRLRVSQFVESAFQRFGLQ